jgi:site-specific DNA-methyltransferase (adenine-specific)
MLFSDKQFIVRCGDSLKLFEKIDNDSVDLVLTSPPYNIGIDYGTYKDNLKWDDYLLWCKKWLIEVQRVLKPDGRFAINVLTNANIKVTDEGRKSPLLDFGGVLKGVGLKVHAVTLWPDKTRQTHTAWGSWCSASSPYIYCAYESIIIGYKDSWKKEIPKQNSISRQDFVEGVKGSYDFGTSNNKNYPATFPLKLPLLMIELLTFVDDVVLDPFCGVGTTGVACLRKQRKFIGFDISEKAISITKKNLKKESKTFFGTIGYNTFSKKKQKKKHERIF